MRDVTSASAAASSAAQLVHCLQMCWRVAAESRPDIQAVLDALRNWLSDAEERGRARLEAAPTTTTVLAQMAASAAASSGGSAETGCRKSHGQEAGRKKTGGQENRHQGKGQNTGEKETRREKSDQTGCQRGRRLKVALKGSGIPSLVETDK